MFCLIFPRGTSAWFPATFPEWFLCHGGQWLTRTDELSDGWSLKGSCWLRLHRANGPEAMAGEQACRYPSLSLYLREGGLSFTDAWPSLALCPEGFTQVALGPHQRSW